MALIYGVPATKEVTAWYVDDLGYTLCAACWDKRGKDLRLYSSVPEDVCEICGECRSIVIIEGTTTIEITPCKIF